MMAGCIIRRDPDYRMYQRGVFQRFVDEGLAQAAFLVGCERTREAVVIDPRRDVSAFVAAAAAHELTIVAAIETHVHADFVSGARELQALGARVYTGPGADLEYTHQQVRDGETLQIGACRLTFLHTPGHTPEHIAVLAEGPDAPSRLFTGDLLFVGAVGRPDLLGEAQTRTLASQLFDSLQRVASLGADVEVHPGHGAGSLCGAGIGKEPSSTIARERAQNAMLRYRDRAAFVDAVMRDIPETPPYFARMKQINRFGPPLLEEIAPREVPSVRPAAAAALAVDGALILDLRSEEAFAEAHPDGALHLTFGSKVGYWSGWVVPPEAPILLLVDEPGQGRDAAVQLRRVGLDRIAGMIVGFEGWSGAGLPVSSLDRISPDALRGLLDAHQPIRVVDVRTPREWQAGHIPGSINVPVGQIAERAAELAGEVPLATICEGGFRSSLAASLLAREGVAKVVNVTGGMAAYRAVEATS
ncbi:MAG: rhodanese-like domain-containing protein [Vicinamibacterales bacterium]